MRDLIRALDALPQQGARVHHQTLDAMLGFDVRGLETTFELLRCLNVDQRTRLDQATRVLTVQRGQRIYELNTPGDKVFLRKSGIVKIARISIQKILDVSRPAIGCVEIVSGHVLDTTQVSAPCA